MTDDDKALVERLRQGHEGPAANRIEELSAENERLKRSADYWEQDAKRYAANQEHWRMEERAAIVAWCRNVNLDWCRCADAIEAGEHLK